MDREDQINEIVNSPTLLQNAAWYGYVLGIRFETEREAAEFFLNEKDKFKNDPSYLPTFQRILNIATTLNQQTDFDRATWYARAAGQNFQSDIEIAAFYVDEVTKAKNDSNYKPTFIENLTRANSHQFQQEYGKKQNSTIKR